MTDKKVAGKTSLTIRNADTYTKFRISAMELGVDVNTLLWGFIEKIVAESEARKNTSLKDWTGEKVPTITDAFETNILPFLKNATDEHLDICKRNARLLYFNSIAYRELSQDKRPTKQFEIMELMKRYSF